MIPEPGFFVPRIFLEFKSTTGKNVFQAMGQLKHAIGKEFGQHYRPKGYLVGISGTNWLFMEYQFVIPESSRQKRTGNDQPDAKLIFCALDAIPYDIALPEGKPDRPTPAPNSANYSTGAGYELDIKNERNLKYVVRLLKWLSFTKGKKCRDLSQAKGLDAIQQPFSESTLGGGLSLMNLLANTAYQMEDDMEVEEDIQELAAPGQRFLHEHEESDAEAGAMNE